MVATKQTLQDRVSRPPLVASAETLGQLVGQFAHDINNQLAVVLASVELAARVDDRTKARELLAGAVAAIERQRVLLEAMATASAACASPQRIDVHALLKSARSVLEGRLGATTLTVEPLARDAIVLCDPTFLLDAFAHMVAQAHCDQPGDALTIETSNGPSTRHDRERQDHLVLIARPSGVNAPESPEHAFALFSESDRSGGLGLAQISDTARRAGGNATLERMAHGGLALRLALPLAAFHTAD
ncbi:hypothetical protein [Dokdonella sp.]|uniref:hypothetical protein n=1 Tax=Dokdonella sp. TaxID=2291710 RepID=UPI003785225C